MSTKTRRKSALLAGLSLAVAGVVGSSLFVTTAQAQVEACPSGWTKRQEAKGYQMCVSTINVIGSHAVQIVDLRAGARVVIGSELKQGSGTAAAKYTTRTIDEWWSFMLNRTSPTGAPLQAIVNASFFMDGSYRDANNAIQYNSVSRLSFAQKKNGYVETSGQGCHNGDCTKPDAWGKRKLGFYENGTKALIKEYTYNGWDYRTTVNYMSDVNDGLIGYGPTGGPATGNSRRNYVGGKDTNGDGALDRLYFLTTVDEITRDQAVSILNTKFGTTISLQMDGGGSAQMKSRTYSFGSLGCLVPPNPIKEYGCRPVPNVLAIYAAS